MATALAFPPRRRRPRLPPIEEVRALAQLLHAGGLTPKDVNRPDQIAVRIVAGLEVGLSPVQAVNNIMVVSGRATIWGDAALALVRASGLLESIDERVEGDGDHRTGVVTVKRAGDSEAKTTRFGVADAKTAGLWEKKGPWSDYPDRMLVMRPRAWALRDNFADVLCGLGIAEEQLDHASATRPAVEVADVKAVPPAAAPQSGPADAAPACGQELLDRIGEARGSWLRSQGVDPGDDDAVRAKWREKLAAYGVTSAKQLSPERAADLLRELSVLGHAQENLEVFPTPPAGSS